MCWGMYNYVYIKSVCVSVMGYYVQKMVRGVWYAYV